MLNVMEVVETKTVYKMELNGKDLLQLLLSGSGVHLAAVELMKRRGTKIEFVFQVPGGGDYSNSELSIDSENPIVVRITEG